MISHAAQTGTTITSTRNVRMVTSRNAVRAKNAVRKP